MPVFYFADRFCFLCAKSKAKFNKGILASFIVLVFALHWLGYWAFDYSYQKPLPVLHNSSEIEQQLTHNLSIWRQNMITGNIDKEQNIDYQYLLTQSYKNIAQWNQMALEGDKNILMALACIYVNLVDKSKASGNINLADQRYLQTAFNLYAYYLERYETDPDVQLAMVKLLKKYRLRLTVGERPKQLLPKRYQHL